MDESIASLCRSLASFSNHLESSCDALTQSLLRRPIPLDSASSTFIQSLNRRVSSASSELNLLESMSLGTVSFEELLGHCNEVYKSNESQILQLQDRLRSYGYVPEIDDGNEILDDDDEIALDVGSKVAHSNNGQVFLDDDDFYALQTLQESIYHFLELCADKSSKFDESLSLKNIGLSNVCLASLASKANNKLEDFDGYFREPTNDKSKDVREPVYPTMGVSKGRIQLDFEETNDVMPVQALSSSINLLKGDYESLPSYIKGLASWEDLLLAVDKINSRLNLKTSGRNLLHQDEISSLELGPKTRSYLLLLVRLNRLKAETIDGLICYTILE